MGSIEIECERDYWTHEWMGFGSASTTNTSISYDTKNRPIGFIWPEGEQDESKEKQETDQNS